MSSFRHSNKDDDCRVSGFGTDSPGNYWSARDFGPDVRYENVYRYANTDRSYFYKPRCMLPSMYGGVQELMPWRRARSISTMGKEMLSTRHQLQRRMALKQR